MIDMQVSLFPTRTYFINQFKLKIKPEPALLEYATQYVNNTLNTDAILLFSPSKIALCALSKAIETTHLSVMWDKYVVACCTCSNIYVATPSLLGNHQNGKILRRKSK
jgi:hypothetical protein